MQNLKNICQFQDHIITSKINNTFLWNKWFLCFYQKDLIAKCQEKMMKISLFFLLFFFGIFIHWNSLDYHVIYRMFYKRGNSKTLPRTVCLRIFCQSTVFFPLSLGTMLRQKIDILCKTKIMEQIRRNEKEMEGKIM